MPRDPRDAMSVKMLPTAVQMIQTDCVSPSGAYSATVTFHSDTCIISTCFMTIGSTIAQCAHVMLHVIHSSEPYCYKWTLTMTNAIDDTKYPSTSALFLMQAIEVNAHKFLVVRCLNQSINTTERHAMTTSTAVA